MSWLETLTTGASTALSLAGELGHVVPGVGEVLSAEQAFYHAGSAIYDGVTGDRDGAINHGTQALYDGVTAIPLISEVVGAADLVAGSAGAAGQFGMQLSGHDSDYVPGGFDDALGQAAVGATRAIFGEDDSNWIAEGDTPTGTRRGEIMAGTAGMTIGSAMAAGAPLPLAALIAGPEGAAFGYGAAELLAEDPDGPTSGVGGNAGLVGDLVQGGLGRVERVHPGIYDGVRGVADDVQRAVQPRSPGPKNARRPADMVFTERELYGTGSGPDMEFTPSEVDREAPADMVFTERELYGTGAGPDMVFTESELGNQSHEPVDMEFTEREVLGTGSGPDMVITPSEVDAARGQR